MVKVAYWDTEANRQTPPLLGQIKGTPTIKAFVPSRKSARNEKAAVDYDQAREVKDLVRFATSRMPNFVERVKTPSELEAVHAKAAEWGLPTVLILSSSGSTASSLKALSTTYRRRLIVAEHKAGKGSELASLLGVDSFPAVLGFKVGFQMGSGDAPLRLEKEPTYNRLDTFFRKLALGKPVLKKPDKAPSKEEL
mmetsp:Transcript_3049/g.5968  ORF Transcript_3049/g.5968 Transcript_3049/m.5968 type:complete len:195 (+) Transcript_3049:231-815(+)